MRSSLPHIVFSGGGTAGHLFPGLAIAEQLASLAQVTFAGSGKDFEMRSVYSAGHNYLPLPCRALPTRLGGAWRFLVDNLKGRRAARHFLRQRHVAAVVGLGGYASVPMARAALSLGVPLALIEQNAVPGRATRWLAPSADLICTAFDDLQPRLQAGCPIRATGNPIRAAISRLFLQSAAAHSPRQLLILGGSGGARALNEAVPRALAELREHLTGWRIVHQTGRADLEATRQRYQRMQLDSVVASFLVDMPRILGGTTLAVCRAGGTTLAELALAGVGAVLVPYPHATDNHQRENAEVYAAAGGCRIIDQRDVGDRFQQQLANLLAELLADESRRAAMSAAMRGLARPDAAWQAASMILEIARNRRPSQV